MQKSLKKYCWFFGPTDGIKQAFWNQPTFSDFKKHWKFSTFSFHQSIDFFFSQQVWKISKTNYHFFIWATYLPTKPNWFIFVHREHVRFACKIIQASCLQYSSAFMPLCPYLTTYNSCYSNHKELKKTLILFKKSENEFFPIYRKNSMHNHILDLRVFTLQKKLWIDCKLQSTVNLPFVKERKREVS